MDDLNLAATLSDGGGDRTFVNPGNANDGVSSSIASIEPFAAAAGTYTGYLESDLGAAAGVGELVVWGDYECSSDPTLGGWHIQFSDDGSAWDDADYTAVRLGTSGSPDHRVRFTLDATETHRYWRLRWQTVIASGFGFRCGTDIYTWEIFGEVSPTEPPVDPGFDPPEPSQAILEIYVHDEDASRWGVATWATGPATGTEGIWSAAGWEDITPQGVNAHIIWGSRRPDRGILAEQDGATWNIETYDPDRILDPGNPDSPFAPQLVAGVPIRISHDGLVIRTGYIDRLRYRHKAPDYRGEIQATSTIALVHRAEVPEDSLLGDTLLERVDDAIVAAEVAVGGLPVRGVLFEAGTGPALSPRIVGSATLWTHIRRAAQEALYVAFERADASIGLRPWGVPLDRSSEITYENLEDLETAISEDGVYSVVRVNNADDTLVIERVAAPLPRYGRRVYERTETTEDPEGWADAILADRAWPGVQYIPGTVHAFSAADVAFLGSLEIMEKLTITVPGVVSVSGRILGMELWVAQTRDAPHGATWMFLPRVATDGSTAIGTTTLVADFTGDTLVDDDTATDYLEADD